MPAGSGKGTSSSSKDNCIGSGSMCILQVVRSSSTTGARDPSFHAKRDGAHILLHHSNHRAHVKELPKCDFNWQGQTGH